MSLERIRREVEAFNFITKEEDLGSLTVFWSDPFVVSNNEGEHQSEMRISEDSDGLTYFVEYLYHSDGATVINSKAIHDKSLSTEAILMDWGDFIRYTEERFGILDTDGEVLEPESILHIKTKWSGVETTTPTPEPPREIGRAHV